MRRWLGSLLLLAFAAALPVSALAQRGVKQVTLNMQTRTSGEYSFSSVPVPTGVVGLTFSMDISEATGSLPVISASLEGSLDGGSTWMPAGAFTRAAGPKGVDKEGVTVSRTGASFFGGTFWNDSTNANRRLRGNATIGGTLRFALEVTPL